MSDKIVNSGVAAYFGGGAVYIGDEGQCHLVECAAGIQDGSVFVFDNSPFGADFGKDEK